MTRFELVGVAPEIVPLVLERSRTQPSVARGERTGWQSGNDLFSWSADTHALGKQIADAVMAAHDRPLEEIALFGWANVFNRGVFFNPHLHSDAAWSGVYYLDAGDSGHAAGGTLMLRDPRAGAGMVIGDANQHDSATCFEITPRSGELWVFPAWLLHWVTPYQSDLPRISISFNAR
ncbi:MAG: TIGR02466 family protein [Kofleriaceae bacterium]